MNRSANNFARLFGSYRFHCTCACLAGLIILQITRQQHALSAIEETIRSTRWVAYAPTNYDPSSAPPLLPTTDDIRTDLEVLRNAGFSGLLTYGSTFGDVAAIASELGFQQVLLGVWDPADPDEAALARRYAQNPVVRGTIVGNEGLTFGRYTFDTLSRAMAEMRRDTGKPVSSTEILDRFYTDARLIEASDFLTVNAHPYFHGYREPARAVDWTVIAWRNLNQRVGNKAILFKEVGLPTAGDDGLSEDSQFEYYRLLLKTNVSFAFFEAFDALFKEGLLEQSWGLYRADRSPKRAAGLIASHAH